MKAQSGKPAAAPDPVTGDGIYHEGDQCTVCAVCFEIGTLCHGTGYDGCCGCTEHCLENHVAHGGKGSEIVGAADERIKTADQGAGASEHDAEAYQPVTGCSNTEIHKVFHQNVAGVFRPGHSRFTESEAGLHEEYHCSA